tara:strand:+ start:93033 stop:94319 length:1287 start_codon:yes stop_codon:yes gene_type:complete
MPQPSLDRYGIDAEQQEQRKQFLMLTDDDARSVAELRQWSGDVAAELADRFYQHLLTHPESARLLSSPELVERLKTEQTRYFEELLAGDYGAEYFDRRLQVGATHYDIGLEPQLYLGAFSHYMQIAFPEFAKRLGTDFPSPLLSLLKVILLDIGLALESYFDKATEQFRRRNQQLEHALQMYFQTEMKAQRYAKLAGHEIRSSLNAIANACEEVVEDFADEIPSEARDTLSRAFSRCWNVMQVVEGILSDPERAGEPQWVDAGSLVDQAAERLKLHVDGDDVAFRRFDGEPQLWADPVGLREVFANLISNAVHHIDKPAASIAVEYSTSSTDHVFSVVDDGPGIPAERVESIFQPFVRGDGESNHNGKGLGLYFVQRIVREHGGSIWVESVPGNGSRFSFTIPREPLVQPASSEPVSSSDDPSAGGAP